MDLFLYDKDLRRKRVNAVWLQLSKIHKASQKLHQKVFISLSYITFERLSSKTKLNIDFWTLV